jgi:hypothetical protein
MGVFSALCKWLGHSWQENSKHWGRHDCKRCNLSKTYYYSSVRGTYYEESVVN